MTCNFRYQLIVRLNTYIQSICLYKLDAHLYKYKETKIKEKEYRILHSIANSDLFESNTTPYSKAINISFEIIPEYLNKNEVTTGGQPKPSH